MSQSLYLDGRHEPIAVDLYGSALRIVRPQAAMALAPLRRLRRVCCWGRVQWAGEALLACAASAIPITFVAKGRGVAHFLPARPRALAFAALIEDAVLHPGWRQRMENWVDSEQVAALTLATGGGGGPWRDVRRALAAGGPRAALRAGIRLPGDALRSRRLWACLQELLDAWTVERLAAEGIPLACFGYSSDKPNLPREFGRALSPLLLPALVRQCRHEAARRGRPGPGDQAGEGSLVHRCALAFAHEEPRLAAGMRATLRRFERLVRDTAEEVGPCPGS